MDRHTRKGFFAVIDRVDGVPVLLEALFYALSELLFVFDNK
ncbi:MAG: hypothetical protein ABA06_00685 [Parcubacteria bacterium C7867-001]|nr:MAG: hypothetical protein ABA06_00685 [Parcubacteria bacterium C7867-001]